MLFLLDLPRDGNAREGGRGRSQAGLDNEHGSNAS